MIDNVCLKIPRKGNEGIIDRIQDAWRKDIHTYSGHIQNMGVFIGLDSVIIHGSLAKYLNGENVSILTREQVEEAIRKLEKEAGVSFEKAIVKFVECGASIITREEPAKYLNLFGYPARFTRHEYAKMAGVETVTYSTETGSYEFSGYNKTLEVQRKKKQQIPPPLVGANILRLEYKIVRRRGIQATFKRDLNPYDLFDPGIYRELQNLFVEMYQAIPKFGRQYHIEALENVTPKTWTELIAEEYRQNFPKEYVYRLKVLRESGALTDKNLERIRVADREREKRYTLLSDESPLIAELDTYILDMVNRI
jgi:hypothetical protein